MGMRNDKTIALLTLGCKLNYAETSTYARGFEKAGLRQVPWSEGADIYLVNSCSVTATSDAKSRNLVRKVLRINPSAIVVVTGCSAQLRRSEYEAIPGVARVFGSDEKSSVVPETLTLAGIVPILGVQGNRSNAAASERSDRGGVGGTLPRPLGVQGDNSNVAEQRSDATIFPAWSSGERTRSFLKVQDGCDNYCAYCTVPYARGASRSVPISECVASARRIASLGVKEIVLTGVNTGDFGKNTGESFLDLLKALEDVDGIERYRISSIEPNLLTEEIIDWIAGGTKFQPHFHIPLQTGTDELLHKMGRRYDTELFASRIEYVRRAMEGPGKCPVFFGIDVMVGLPGETPELFERTCEFLASRVHPAFIHVFPYSRRPGTPAASMPGQVGEEEKKRRVAVLEELSTRLHYEFVASNRGLRARVLFESTDRKGFMEGYTGNYFRVSRPYDAALCGQIVEVTI